MGYRPSNIVGVESVVETDTFREAFDAAVGAAGKDAAAGWAGQGYPCPRSTDSAKDEGLSTKNEVEQTREKVRLHFSL